MKLVQIFAKQSKFFYGLLVAVLLAGLVGACGAENTPVPAATTEAVTSAAPTTAATTSTTVAALPAEATTEAATTQAVTTAAATTSAPTTAAPMTTPARTTAATTSAVATTPAKTTAASTTAAAATGPLKPSVLLSPMRWESQTMNNCGPTTVSMVLSYYDIILNQEQCRKSLRPNPEDRQTYAEDMMAFIRKQGLRVSLREDGDLNKLRALLSAGVPVITQQWLKDGDDIGHWRIARGYNLANNTIIFNDSMDTKPQTVVSAAYQDKLWKAFDRRYLPVYTAKTEATVLAILGEDAKYESNLQRALDAAEKYAQTNAGDIDGWRNLGYLRAEAGDCKGAISVWETKLVKMLIPTDTGPYNRFLWYQLWPMECYNTLGSFAKVTDLATITLKSAPVFAQARYQYAVALMGLNRKPEAITQLKRAVVDDPTYGASFTMLEKLGVS